LLIALGLAAAGCLVYYIPFFANFNDWRPLIAGAAFGGALTEFINDLHRAEDRREQRRSELDQELRYEDLRGQNGHLQMQLEILQKDTAYLRARNPDLHPNEHAIRLGSCFAQLHLLGRLRAPAHLRYQRANIRAIAKMLEVEEQYVRAITNAGLKADEKLDRDQWRELLIETGANLRRLQGEGAQDGFILGYKIEKIAIRLRAPIKYPDLDDLQPLRMAVDIYRLSEPFKSWVLANLEAAFDKSATVRASRMFLQLYASMLSFSHYLRDAAEEQSVANVPGASEAGCAPDDSQFRFVISALPIREMFAIVVKKFPNIQLADVRDLERIFIPYGSDPRVYVF
jgi:hypothetical protein